MPKHEIETAQDVDYSSGFRLALEGSRQLFQAAEAAEVARAFGVANSLMILSAEEALKAIELFGHYVFPETEREDLVKAFRSHEYKLGTIQAMMVVSRFFDKLHELHYGPMLSNLDLPPDEFKRQREINSEKMMKWFGKHKHGHPEWNALGEWWGKAASMKLRGFYVDFKNGEWLSPTSITEKDYQRSKAYVHEFIERAEVLNKINTEDEFFLEFRDLFTHEFLPKFKELKAELVAQLETTQTP